MPIIVLASCVGDVVLLSLKPNTHAMLSQALKVVKVKEPHSFIGCQMKYLATIWEGDGSNRSLCDLREFFSPQDSMLAKGSLSEIVVLEPATVTSQGSFSLDPLPERKLRRLGSHQANLP